MSSGVEGAGVVDSGVEDSDVEDSGVEGVGGVKVGAGGEREGEVCAGDSVSGAVCPVISVFGGAEESVTGCFSVGKEGAEAQQDKKERSIQTITSSVFFIKDPLCSVHRVFCKRKELAHTRV